MFSHHQFGWKLNYILGATRDNNLIKQGINDAASNTDKVIVQQGDKMYKQFGNKEQIKTINTTFRFTGESAGEVKFWQDQVEEKG